MAENQANCSTAKGKSRTRFWQIFRWSFRRSIRLALLTFIVLTFIGGLVLWYDLAFGDGEIPIPNQANFEVSKNACYNSTFSSWSEDPEENWKALQPTIRILKPVCPHVVEWVTERYESGHIIWVDPEDSSRKLATYNYFTGDLEIYRNVFLWSDGEKACTLAHEWRHSRQNWTCFAKEILSVVFLNIKNKDCVEDDAEKYEYEVRLAYYNEDVVIYLIGRRLFNDIFRKRSIRSSESVPDDKLGQQSD